MLSSCLMRLDVSRRCTGQKHDPLNVPEPADEGRERALVGKPAGVLKNCNRPASCASMGCRSCAHLRLAMSLGYGAAQGRTGIEWADRKHCTGDAGAMLSSTSVCDSQGLPQAEILKFCQ
jgi:hypothetical protein